MITPIGGLDVADRREERPALAISIELDDRARAQQRVIPVDHKQPCSRLERYCCCRSAQEWRAAKRGSLAGFVRSIAGKVNARYAADDLDATRYQEIAPRLNELT